MTSTWRRNADEALPARGKIVGGYVNMAFQKSEAELNGFDEALVLTADGHVNESSAANLFVVRDGVAHDAAGQRRPPRGRDPQGAPGAAGERGHLTGRDPLDRSVRDLRRRRDVPVRHRRPGVAGRRGRPPRRSVRARSARSPGWSATATSTPSAAGCRHTATGSPRSSSRSRRASAAAQDAVAAPGSGVVRPIVDDDVGPDRRVGRGLDRHLEQLLEVRDRRRDALSAPL